MYDTKTYKTLTQWKKIPVYSNINDNKRMANIVSSKKCLIQNYYNVIHA